MVGGLQVLFRIHGEVTRFGGNAGAGVWGKIHPTFRWQAANLLAFTKFIGSGLFIK